MRLVCPNCDAKYEVPDGAIPQGGRDVQCSACGHAWFQQSLEVEAAAAAEAAAALFADDLDDKGPVAGQAYVGLAAPSAEDAADDPAEKPAVAAAGAGLIGSEGDPDPDATLAAAIGEIVTETPPALAAALPPRQELDEDVRSVLREEAEREAESRRVEAQRAGARKAEAEGQMQVQPELGVEPAAAPLTPTQRRLAMLQGNDPDAPPAQPIRPTARRDLLPDVEEINSTLQPGDAALDAEIDALPDLTKGRSSFRTGFFLVILLLMIATAIYVLAPQLAERFPSLAETLDRYVVFVDALRHWLNEKMNAATAALSG